MTMTDQRFQPRRIYRCAVCGGLAHRRTSMVAPPGMEDVWQPLLHSDLEDWLDSPHNVDPVDDGATFPRVLDVRIPYVGDGRDGCLRSAEIDRAEADTLSLGDTRRDLLLASADRWEAQARTEKS